MVNQPKLDQEEQALLNSFESGEFESVLTPELKQATKNAAERTLKKDKRINIRISSHDLLALQRRAVKEGIPYQSLVSSVLHKYVTGSLQDKIANS